MHWLPSANWLRAFLVLVCAIGCEAQPLPQQAVDPPLPQQAELPVIAPVHLGEERLRSPLLEGLRQQIENSESDETREVTQPLTKQLAAADLLLSEAHERNRAAIQQANRQVRIGAARQSPNFLLITVDRMGVGDLSCYGQMHWKTSALDKLAADGLRFTQCYSGLNPTTSNLSLLTADIVAGTSSRRTMGLLPQVLWNAGYKTALIGEWTGESPPALLGYEESSGWNQAPGDFPDWALLNGNRIALESNSRGQRQDSSTDFLISEVRSFLREARGRPNQFFLHISIRLFDDFDDESLSAQDYAARIRQADTTSGRILEAVDEFGLGNRTCSFFLALGGPLPSLNRLMRETQSTADFSHSANELREGNLRVPFLVRWPGQIRAGTVSEVTAGPWDLLPTLAQLAWVSRPLGRIDGRSLVEVLRHDHPIKDRRIVWRSPTGGSVLAVRDENWKFVRTESGNDQLFDLTLDRAEQRDVAKEHADVVLRMIK